MDLITKRLFEKLEKELKELYEYIDSIAPPKEEEKEDERKKQNK